MTIRRGRSWKAIGLDIVTLRVFAAAVEEKSLAAAASREHLSLSAVSRRLTELEVRTGVALLQRDFRGVSATPAGQQLLSKLSKTFAYLESIAAELDALRNGVHGSVRIQGHSAALALLPEHIASLTRLHSQIRFELEEKNSSEIVQNVMRGDVELGFVSACAVNAELQHLAWHNDELIAVMPIHHPLSHFDALKLEQIATYPIVTMQRKGAIHALLTHHASAAGLELDIQAFNSSFENARRIVGHGLGVAVLPRLAVADHTYADTLITRPLDEGWAHQDLYLCYRDYETLPEAARKIVAYFKSTSAARNGSRATT